MEIKNIPITLTNSFERKIKIIENIETQEHQKQTFKYYSFLYIYNFVLKLIASFNQGGEA